MREEKLLRTFGEIDDDLIEEAAQTTRPIPLFRLIACAAAVLLLTAVAAVSFGRSELPVDTPATTTTTAALTETKNQGGTTTKQANSVTATKRRTQKATTTAPATTTKRLPEIAIIPHWDEKSLNEQFPEAVLGDVQYSVLAHTMDPQFVDKSLGTVTMHGQDVYTDTAYTKTARLYAIKKIATPCAVAVQYEGSEAYYSAIATRYRPETLGEFWDHLNLEQYLDLGAVYIQNSPTPHDHLLSKQDLLAFLQDNRSTPNVYEDSWMWDPVLDFPVGIPVLGIENVSMSISADGYLLTNLLGTGKAFFIGADRVDALLQKLNITTTTTQATTTAGGTVTKPAVPPKTTVSAAYIPE